MKFTKLQKSAIIVFVSILVCMFSFLSVGALDNDPVTGSIEVVFGSEVTEMELELFEVADITNGKYVLNDSFASSNVSVDNLTDSVAAQNVAGALAGFARENGLSGVTADISDGGKVRFENVLAKKLYLILPLNVKDFDVQPILAVVPYFKDGTDIYNITVDAKYEEILSAVILHKTDNRGEPLSGAVFTLQQFTADGWNDLLTGLTSDEYGQIVADKLSLGKYRFIETAAPDGYGLDSQPHEFELSSAGTITLENGIYKVQSGDVAELTVQNIPSDDTHLKVDKKVSGDNGKTWGVEANINAVSGQKAYWKISAEIAEVMERISLYVVRDVLADSLVPPKEDEFEITVEGKEIPKECYTIRVKDYEITVNFNTEALIPYNGKTVDIVFPTAIDLTKPGAVGMRIDNVATLSFVNVDGSSPSPDDTDKDPATDTDTNVVNEIVTTTVTVWTGEIDGYKHDNDDNPLSGAEFTLYSDKECKKEVTKTTSGSDGHFYIKGLLDGTYYLKETKAPNGYQANTEIFEIKVDEKSASEPIKIDVLNIKKPNLPITGGAGIIGISMAGFSIAVVGAFIMYSAFRVRKREKLKAV